MPHLISSQVFIGTHESAFPVAYVMVTKNYLVSRNYSSKVFCQITTIRGVAYFTQTQDQHTRWLYLSVEFQKNNFSEIKTGCKSGLVPVMLVGGKGFPGVPLFYHRLSQRGIFSLWLRRRQAEHNKIKLI